MNFIERKPADNYSGEFLKLHIAEKEKVIKLDNLLSVLNFLNLDPDKIKVDFVKDGENGTDVTYHKVEASELFVLKFRDVDDILEFKVKGTVMNCKISILMNFAENYLQIKSDYLKTFKYKHLKTLIDKLVN